MGYCITCSQYRLTELEAERDQWVEDNTRLQDENRQLRKRLDQYTQPVLEYVVSSDNNPHLAVERLEQDLVLMTERYHKLIRKWCERTSEDQKRREAAHFCKHLLQEVDNLLRDSIVAKSPRQSQLIARLRRKIKTCFAHINHFHPEKKELPETEA